MPKESRKQLFKSKKSKSKMEKQLSSSKMEKQLSRSKMEKQLSRSQIIELNLRRARLEKAQAQLSGSQINGLDLICDRRERAMKQAHEQFSKNETPSNLEKVHFETNEKKKKLLFELWKDYQKISSEETTYLSNIIKTSYEHKNIRNLSIESKYRTLENIMNNLSNIYTELKEVIKLIDDSYLQFEKIESKNKLNNPFDIYSIFDIFKIPEYRLFKYHYDLYKKTNNITDELYDSHYILIKHITKSMYWKVHSYDEKRGIIEHIYYSVLEKFDIDELKKLMIFKNFGLLLEKQIQFEKFQNEVIGIIEQSHKFQNTDKPLELNKDEKDIKNIANKNDNVNNKNDDEDDKKICAICLKNERNCVLVHSNDTAHMVSCYDCAKLLKNRDSNCPICRQKIISINIVYIS
jgi:hypothetical protein